MKEKTTKTKKAKDADPNILEESIPEYAPEEKEVEAPPVLEKKIRVATL